MSATSLQEIDLIQRIGAVPTILSTVAATTGLGFVCIAHVTKDSWTTCAVLDKLNFGLKVGDGLDVTTTLCEEVRDTGHAIIIDSVKDDAHYHDHHTPRMYGFQSYFSIPIFRPNGDYFGTLCGLDPNPANLSNPTTVASMTLFAQLISLQLEAETQLADARQSLQDEKETAELREQFIAVLGHDLRTPVSAIVNGVALARRRVTDPAAIPIFNAMDRSARRISALIDDVVDFTKGRMGGGISLDLRHQKNMEHGFDQVIAELQGLYPDREINARLQRDINLFCDAGRMGQLLSNLLKNALVHGDKDHAVEISAISTNGIFQLAVSNAGPRIPAEIVSQFFKPFWRGPSNAQHEGLGLGLFIVSEIARSHNGTVNVITSDKSTTFVYQMKGPDFVERRALPRN